MGLIPDTAGWEVQGVLELVDLLGVGWVLPYQARSCSFPLAGGWSLVLWLESEVAQLCPTLCDSMDYSPPGSSIHGILQARILQWVAISFSRGSSWPRDWTRVSCIAGRCFTIWATRKAHRLANGWGLDPGNSGAGPYSLVAAPGSWGLCETMGIWLSCTCTGMWRQVLGHLMGRDVSRGSCGLRGS